jgi:hypothetical protein
MQLVGVIQVGVDANGNGVADLDPSRIYYLGQSLGDINGTTFLTVEPTNLDGVSVLGQRFDENMPLRDGVPLVVRLIIGNQSFGDTGGDSGADGASVGVHGPR